MSIKGSYSWRFGSSEYSSSRWRSGQSGRFWFVPQTLPQRKLHEIKSGENDFKLKQLTNRNLID